MGSSALNRASADALSAAHPALAAIVARIGPPTLPRKQPTAGFFAALCESVAYQQLAGAAAATIHGRFVTACGGEVTPERVASVPFDALRAAGLSGSKATTISGIASAVLDESLPLHRFGRMSDAEVVRSLSALRGIGPWTAEMFLMFQLGRRDVWPVTDYGVRVGWTKLFGEADLISSKALLTAGEQYSPHRSALAWYCWHVADTRGRSED